MKKQTIGLIIAGVLVLLGGVALVAKSTSSVATKSVILSVTKNQSPAVVINIKKGQTVKITINSEIDGETHLHDYDIYTNLEAGKSSTTEFVASLTGEFELENHETEELIAVFKVSN